jgi:alpha-L-fucosidase
MRNPSRFVSHTAIVFCFLFSFLIPAACAQSGDQPSPENLQARREFQDMKFGLFIHWGVYSVLGDGEWVFRERQLTVDQYNRLPLCSSIPKSSTPHTWVSLAKAAGMKYITITSRHHDGFAMFDSKVSDWNIVARTPYKRGSAEDAGRRVPPPGHQALLLLLAARLAQSRLLPARGQTTGIQRPPRPRRLQQLISTITWTASSPSSSPTTAPSAASGSTACGISPTLTGIWQKTYALIHKLQPAALIIPNHHQKPIAGEDVQTFERDLPGSNSAGFNTTFISTELPLESSDTLNDNWGFNIGDSHYKSAEELERRLIRAAGNNANLLMNIGPYPNGEIDPQFVTRLHAVGEWLAKYGDSIYGTRGGPIPPGDWGVTTHKDNKIYVHVLNWGSPLLALGPVSGKISSAQLLADGAKADVTQTADGVIVKLPAPRKDEVDRVVVLTVGGRD